MNGSHDKILVMVVMMVIHMKMIVVMEIMNIYDDNFIKLLLTLVMLKANK